MNKPIETLSADKTRYLRERTDKYFSKSRDIVERFGDRIVTYGVFLRRGVICAVNPAGKFDIKLGREKLFQGLKP